MIPAIDPSRSGRCRHSALRAALVILAPLLAASALPAETAGARVRPRLRLHYDPAPAAAIRLELRDGPQLGFAWLLAEDAGQPASAVLAAWGSADPRTSGAPPAGRVLAGLRLDVDGAGEWVARPGGIPAGTRLRALTLAGGGLASARSSATVVVTGRPEQDPAVATRLIVTEFQKDPTTVGDSAGEWLEVHNPTRRAVDIAGWVLSDLGSESTVLDAGGGRILVPARGSFVLGRNADTAANGGVPVDFVYGGFTLSNGDDEIVLSMPDGTLVDQIAYDDGVVWPDEPGRSISLDRDDYDEVLNDDGARWCSSLRRLGWGNTNTGTPGAQNEDCR